MTEGTIAAAPVSRIQLRAYAAAWRSAMGLGDEIYMPVSEILERLPLWFEEVGLSVEVVPVQELSGDDRADDILFHVRRDALLRDFGVVLSGEHHRIHADGRFAVVFHRDLRLAVRAEIGERAVLPKL